MKIIGIRTALWFWTSGLLLWLPAAVRVRRCSRRAAPADPCERGDVPGWVMITLMSAVLVAALLALAGPALEALFNQAMDKVGQ